MKLILTLLLLTTTAFAQDIYKLKEKSIDGKEFDLSSLKGKPVLIVNIASQCGYTPQLTDLEALHQKYKEKGLVVLGVPSNDFGFQTPEDDKGMAEFCSKKYNVTFPLLSKRPVSGDKQCELYKILTDKKSGKEGFVKWNFEKFLISKDGKVVSRYESKVKPMDEQLTKDIEKQL